MTETTYTLSESEMEAIRIALAIAVVSNNYQLKTAMENGWGTVAGAFARDTIRIERASYIAWQLSGFPAP
jgi:hypothetical protein